MQKWQARSSLPSIGRLQSSRMQACVGCALRQFSATFSLLDDAPLPSPSESAPGGFTKRQRSARAGRQIEGLRQAAPGGFGSSPSKRPARPQTADSPRHSVIQKVVYTRDGPRPQPPSSILSSDRAKNGQTFQMNRSPQNRPGMVRGRGPRPVGRSRDGPAQKRQGGNRKGPQVDPKALEQGVLARLDWAQKKAAKPIRKFSPEAFEVEELITDRVAMAAGQTGIVTEMQDAIGRLARRDDLDWQSDEPLARQLIAGQLVRFRDVAEKKRVMELAEEFASQTANKIQKRKGEFVDKEDVGFVPVGPKEREGLVDLAMKGKYEQIKPVEGANLKEKSMAQLRQAVTLNSTYTPSAAKSMVGFIEKMWPQQAQPSTSIGSSKGKQHSL